ncbi:MAG TPA: CoA transferase [Candidatus Limnocylindria bacterium]|nr:CoA transferase [Candidatus Limnocylindria bacterium]
MSGPPPAAPLAGITVLDLSRVLAGPYATQLLGDLGAEVWKVERPGLGDETRAWGPPFVAGVSAYFLSVNRNKRSVALDFNDGAARAAVRRAALASDVVVENFVPGDLARYGLDASSLRRDRPDLIVCSITGFGQDGPYATLPGYDAVMQGFTGLMSVTGAPDGPPTKVGVAVIDVLTGVHAAAAILAALVGRLRGAGGAHLDLALYEVGVASLVNLSQAALATGQPARRHGNAHPQIVPYQTFQAADGLLVVAVGNDEQWRRLCSALDAPELASDARYASNPERVLHRTGVVEDLSRRFASRPRAAWIERLQAARVPCGPVRDLDEVMRDPVLRERDLVRASPGAGARGTSSPAPATSEGPPLLALPWRISGERPPLRTSPPSLGADTSEFLARFAPS